MNQTTWALAAVFFTACSTGSNTDPNLDQGAGSADALRRRKPPRDAGSDAMHMDAASDATGATGSADAGGPTTTPTPDGGVAASPGTTSLVFPPAPSLGTVNVVANRSSVRLMLPSVPGVRDYRVFAVENGVAVSVDSANHEHVTGATLYCGGLKQRNQCGDDEILPLQYNNSLLDMPKCEIPNIDRRPNVPTQLMQTLEVNGLRANTTLVVEAIDRLCPFPGMAGTAHLDVPIANVDIGSPTENAVINNVPYTLQLLPATFPVVTEAEIRARYGSMIFNGQGPNQPTLDPSSPSFPESPFIRIAQPAPPNDPIVLARSVITVNPLGTASLPQGFGANDFWDDFEDDTDQPALLTQTDPATNFVHPISVYQTKKWVLYDVANQFSQFFIGRGQMNMVMGDPYQDSMTTQAMYPRARPVHLPTAADRYLYVTYEVQRNETARRYENLSLCGSDQVGQTYHGDAPAAAPVPRPGFMNSQETHPTNVLGWNCLYLVPRGLGYGTLPGGDIASHADTSLDITVVRTHPAPTPDQYDSTTLDAFSTTFGPTQEGPYPNRWERQVDSTGKLVGAWLDDQLNIEQRTRFDVFIRRDRVVIYVEGQQRLCQAINPATMTMAEGALGFWHILYHSSAEFSEIRAGYDTANPQTDQHHVMHNTPFSDMRSYDNVGIREDAPLPANFDATLCFAGSSRGIP